MPSFDLSEEGVVVRHGSKHDTKSKHTEPTQVFRLDLIESVTKDVLRSLRNNEQVRLRCGKKPTVQLGKKTIHLESSIDQYPSEIFTKSADNASPLYFSGRSSHRLEARKAEKAIAKTDEALATLENTLKSIQEERASNETSLKEEGLKKGVKPSPLLGQTSALRKEHFLGSLNRSTPGSPFLSASFSPRLGPTSAPLAPGISARDRVRLDAIRIPLVHLLAVRPITPKSICNMLHANKDDIDKLLDKVSWESKAEEGKRELKEKLYRELVVWQFPYRSQDDRQLAIDHAIQAYDRMRVEKKDPLWQLLLPVDERGKGKLLSKLNFDKPAPSHATPKPGDDGNESKTETERDPTKKRSKKDTDTVVVEKARKDKSASSKLPSKGEAGATLKRRDKDQSKSAKVEGKFKSAERIIDSDDEASAADHILVKPKKQDTPSGSVTKRKPEHEKLKSVKSQLPSASPLPTASPKKAIHKSSLSSVSSSSSNSSGNERPVSTASNSSHSLKPQSQHQKPDSSGSRISPRPRHDSSPQKPSPLGSSPPTSSTDADNSSSSKASNQSSAPSSPSSSTDMPQTRAGNKYSPIISDKSRNVSRGRSPGANPAKRKAAPTEDERPAKRHQQQQQDSRPRSSHLKPPTNGTSEHIAVKSPAERPAGPIRTDSERSSSPEKPGPKRDDIVEDARRFQKYYKKYKDLHDKIEQTAEKDRDDKDMDDLWRMHKRLKEMKADIWANWEKVEKTGKAGIQRNVTEMLAV